MDTSDPGIEAARGSVVFDATARLCICQRNAAVTAEQVALLQEQVAYTQKHLEASRIQLDHARLIAEHFRTQRSAIEHLTAAQK